MVVVVIVVVHNDHEGSSLAHFLQPTAGLCRETLLPGHLPTLWNAYDLLYCVMEILLSLRSLTSLVAQIFRSLRQVKSSNFYSTLGPKAGSAGGISELSPL